MKFKKNLLLWNYCANLNQTLLKWSLCGSLSKLCPSAPSCIQDGRAGHIFEREPSNDYFIKILFLLSKWFQKRRFLWEFSIGSYVKLSSAVAAILVGGLQKIENNFITNRTFTICYNIKFLADYGGKFMLLSLNFAWNGILLTAFKVNNSWKTHNFRIKVGNVQVTDYN
jgi:hypothetical protein